MIDALNDGRSKIAPALGLAMRTRAATKGKEYSVDQWCEIFKFNGGKGVATNEDRLCTDSESVPKSGADLATSCE